MKRILGVTALVAVIALSMLAGAAVHAQVNETRPEARTTQEDCAEAAKHPSGTVTRLGPPRVLMGVQASHFVDTIRLYELSMDNPRYLVTSFVEAKGIFIRIEATFVNVSDSVLLINNDGDFSLIDEKGTSYRVATPATMTHRRVRSRETPIVDVRVRPGATYDALLFFEIPRTGVQRELKLRFRDDSPVPFRLLPN